MDDPNIRYVYILSFPTVGKYNHIFIAFFTFLGRHVTDYGLPAPAPVIHENNEVREQLQYDAEALTADVEMALPSFTDEQRSFYDAVLETIDSNVPAIFFLNASGGTGKTYLLNLLLWTVRSRRDIAVALASTGIASTLLQGG